jgi:hypothetical protein
VAGKPIFPTGRGWSDNRSATRRQKSAQSTGVVLNDWLSSSWQIETAIELFIGLATGPIDLRADPAMEAGSVNQSTQQT